MIKIPLKSLSVNAAYRGRRFKSAAYKDFEEDLNKVLPRGVVIPEGPLSVTYVFSFSNKRADLGNSEKVLTDILQNAYGFDDNRIFHIEMFKKIVPKGEEYIQFNILPYEQKTS